MLGPRPLFLIGVRHGESEGNWADALERQGDTSAVHLLHEKRHETNFRLTDRGRTQCQLTGAWLRQAYHMGFDRYYCSDTVRGRESAAHLGLEGAEWEPVSLLRERDSREYGAMTEEHKREFLASLAGSLLDSPYYFHPFGEAPADLIDHRITPMLNRVSGRDLGSVIWVCHGDYLRALKGRLWHLTKDEWAELYTDESDQAQILNGTVHIYSRQDPECSSRILRYFGWFKSVCPWAPEHPSNTRGWVRVERKKFTNEDLIHSVERFEQLVNHSTPLDRSST